MAKTNRCILLYGIIKYSILLYKNLRMKKISNYLILFAFIAAIVSCGTSTKLSGKKVPEIKNIILMIGDGMGLPDVYAAMTVSDKSLNIERCNVTGLQKTFSANNYITDSGAAGTALATGTKTKNGAIGVDSQGNRLKSILEIAEKHGLATGLVSTSAITDATPASFIAHQSSRINYEAIALDFLRTDIDVFIGGGYNNFAKRADKVNLLDSLKFKGYEVDTTIDIIMKSSSRKIAGLTSPFNNPVRLKGRGDMLPESTSKAIEVLSKNKKGFFLMVEGSEIDKVAHLNAADTLIDEILDFDKAVGAALDFAEKDKHTLVIITADHETGGVTIIGGDKNTHQIKLNFSSRGHTAVPVPVYAYGAGADKFTGIYDNTDIFNKILTAYGFGNLK
jgi:alkaline phosphatase